MKEFFENAWYWFVSIFEESPGVASSKRIQSTVLIVIALIVALTVKDVAMVIAFLGAALGLQGITAFQR